LLSRYFPIPTQSTSVPVCSAPTERRGDGAWALLESVRADSNAAFTPPNGTRTVPDTFVTQKDGLHSKPDRIRSPKNSAASQSNDAIGKKNDADSKPNNSRTKLNGIPSKPNDVSSHWASHFNALDPRLSRWHSGLFQLEGFFCQSGTLSGGSELNWSHSGAEFWGAGMLFRELRRGNGAAEASYCESGTKLSASETGWREAHAFYNRSELNLRLFLPNPIC
jgi:hypothetical protein